MALFTGTYEGKVDDKGRVSLPANFRALLPNTDERSFFIVPSVKLPCLEAFDTGYAEKIAVCIETRTEAFSEQEDALTHYISHAHRAQFDVTGRFVLPTALAHHADITDQALFVGMVRRFQIWRPEFYAEHAERKQQLAKTAELGVMPPRETGK